MVCRPEEQKRLTVTPAVVIGRPASSAAWRPMLRRAVGAVAQIAVLDIVLGDAGALDRVLDGVARPCDIGGVMLNPPRPDLARPVRA